MNSKEIAVIETWGRRLSGEVQRFANRHLPDLLWLRQLSPVFERVSALSGSTQTRFERIDAIKPKRPEPALAAPPSEEEGLPLPTAMRERLAPSSGTGWGDVRIHTGRKADAMAKEHRAQAVTIDRNIYFREGSYRPDEPVGLALLGHEMEHIFAALRPNGAWRRATAAGLQEEERQALARERQIIAAPGVETPREQSYPSPSADIPTVRSLRTPPQASPRAAATPLHRPMPAEVGRNVEEQPAAQQAVPINFEALRHELYRDLLGQIRSDLERGA